MFAFMFEHHLSNVFPVHEGQYQRKDLPKMHLKMQQPDTEQSHPLTCKHKVPAGIFSHNKSHTTKFLNYGYYLLGWMNCLCNVCSIFL